MYPVEYLFVLHVNQCTQGDNERTTSPKRILCLDIFKLFCLLVFIYPCTVLALWQYLKPNQTNNVHIFLLATQRKVCYLTWPDTPERNAGKKMHKLGLGLNKSVFFQLAARSFSHAHKMYLVRIIFVCFCVWRAVSDATSLIKNSLKTKKTAAKHSIAIQSKLLTEIFLFVWFILTLAKIK